MMSNEMTKYSSEEILQILTDFYNYQSQFDPVVYRDLEISYETIIDNWREACDLLEPKKLAKYFHDMFKLNTPISDLENILIHEKETTLKDFCEYISENAYKEEIKPVISMGKICQEAAIFKTLISKLKERGITTDTIKPSSEFSPLFKKHGDAFLTEVNKLVPGSLTHFEYKDNWIVRIGWFMIGIFILSTIIIPLIWHFHWGLWIILGSGIAIVIIGRLFKPEKEVIGGYNTIHDLIIGMQKQMNKVAM
jgi:hypothetical protein